MIFGCLRRKRRASAPAAPASPSEATTARIRAEVDLEHVRAQTPRYRALSDSLRELREHNHLAQSFETAFKKGRTT